MTGVVATGFGIGFAVNQPFLGSALGIVVGSALVALIISRAPSEAGDPTTGRL
jgi:tryptophan synthase alpha subunit